MIALQETTNWGEHNTPNHLYVFESKESSRIIAYVDNTRGEWRILKYPMLLDKKYRTFKEVKGFDFSSMLAEKEKNDQR